MPVPAAAVLAPARTLRYRPTQQPDDREQQSLLKEIGNRTLGGAAGVGNFLDLVLGASSVRDIIAGENPFDQFLTPFSAENRVTGRELLERYHVLGPNQKGFDWGDVAGFLTEVGLDPGTYTGLGGLGKVGQIVKKAGVLDELLPEAGRLAKMTTTFGDILGKANEVQRGLLDDAARAAGFADAAEVAAKHGSDPLGGLVGVGLPFRDPTFTAGVGPTAQKVAGALDLVGNKLRYSAPGRLTAALFSRENLGALTETGQRMAHKISRLWRGAEARGREAVAGAIRGLWESGVSDSVDAWRSVTRAMEGVEGLPSDLSHLQPHVDTMRKALDGQLGEELGAFLNTADLHDLVNYLPRQMARFADAPDVPEWILSRVLKTTHKGQLNRKDFLRELVGGTDLLNALSMDLRFSGRLRRGAVEGIEDLPKVERAALQSGDSVRIPLSDEAEELLAKLDEGGAVPAFVTNNLRKILKDNGLDDAMIQTMTPEQLVQELRDRGQGRIFGFKDGNPVVGSKALAADGKNPALVKQFTKEQLADAQPLPHRYGEINWDAHADELEKVVTQWTKDHGYPIGQRIFEEGQIKKLAHWLADLDPRYADNGVPVFGTNPLENVMNRLEHGGRAVAASKVIRETLAEHALDAGDVSVRDLLERTGLTEGAFDDVVEQMRGLGRQVDDEVDDLFVSKDLAGDIERVMKPMTTPDEMSKLGEVADKVTQFWKGSVTGYFPAFHVRNFISGQIQNMLAGAWSFRSMKQAWDLLRGKEIKGLAEAIPAFRGMTDGEATAKLAELIFSRKITSPHQAMQGLEGASNARDLAHMIPGLEPRTLRKTLIPDEIPGTTWRDRWDPRNVANVRTEQDIFTPQRIARNVGEFTEEMNRITPTIELLKKGYSIDEVAKRVRALQVDYSNLSQFERTVMRRAFPFYGFARGMAEYVTKELTERPGGALAQLLRAQRLTRGEGDEPTPQYVGETASIPLESLPGGGQRYLTGFGAMHEDPLSFLSFRGGLPDASGILAEVISRSNPAIKLPVELAAGESFFQRGPMGGRELADMDPVMGRILANAGIRPVPEGQYRAQPFLGQTFEHVVANSPAARFLSTARTATDPRKYEGRVPGGAAALNLLTGARVSDVSPGASQAILEEELSATMREAGAKAYTDVYFSREQIAAAEQGGDRERAESMRQYNALRTYLANRTKERVAARRAAAR